MSEEITRDDLVHVLASLPKRAWTCDDMTHRGVGRSRVEWWKVGPLFVWRVVLFPKGENKAHAYVTRFGETDSADCGVATDAATARADARRAATRHAKHFAAGDIFATA